MPAKPLVMISKHNQAGGKRPLKPPSQLQKIDAALAWVDALRSIWVRYKTVSALLSPALGNTVNNLSESA